MSGDDPAAADDGSGNSASAAEHWFEPVAAHLGPAYLKYSFTKGTVAEVDSLLDLAALAPGSRILDIGCGPGRHCLELARRGFEVVGVDISSTFIELATASAREAGLDNARFFVGDARDLHSPTGAAPDGGLESSFDLVMSLCQGAFGLTAGPGNRRGDPASRLQNELDEPVLAGMARAAKPGALVAVSAFSAYFQLRFEEDSDSFDADLGVNEEQTLIRNVAGDEQSVRLWTTCYTPRELRLLARIVGLVPVGLYGVTPGRYRPSPAVTDCPEFLLLAARPHE